ncbi:MATE family efflux transporter [Grimontia indica]|nr:MATE family efflux transporter [Grimontia indica]
MILILITLKVTIVTTRHKVSPTSPLPHVKVASSSRIMTIHYSLYTKIMTSKNRVLDAPIVPTFFYFAIPSFIGLVAISSASIVDGMFVGRFLGADALAAINLLIPYITFVFAVSLMIAIGGTVQAGEHIGKDELDKANAAFTQSMLGAFGFSSSMAMISSIFSTELFYFLGAPASLHPLMERYFSVLTVCMIVQLTTMVLYYFVRADGFPMLATSALMVGAATNITLDYVFLGVLGLGIEWAAWATTFAQLLQLSVLIFYFAKPSRTLSLSKAGLEIRKFVSALINGASEFINEISVGIVIFTVHWLLMKNGGQEAVAGFSIANYILFVSMMMFYGVVDAIHILVSQNKGAGNLYRINRFMALAATTIVFISSALVYLCLVKPDTVTELFLTDLDEKASSHALSYIAIIWPCLMLSGINVLISAYFTAMQLPKQSAAIALSRGLVLPVSLIFGLVIFFKDQHFLTALPLAEFFTLLIACALFIRQQKHMSIKRPLATSNA